MSYYEFQTTPRYVQCEDALSELRRYTHGLGKTFLAVTACGPMTDLVREKITRSFYTPMVSLLKPNLKETNHKYAAYEAAAREYDREDIRCDLYFLDCEARKITSSEVQWLAEYARERGVDVVIGVGGGKGMDFARAVAHLLPVKVVLAPTSAATNASVSQMCVIYNEEGSEIEGFWSLPRPQELVIADTEILIKAPPRTLAAGIGDCISTYYEAQNVLARLDRRAYYADLTWDAIECSISILRRQGKRAIEAAERGEIDHAYESVVSQILHNCGPIRAITGVGYAHVLDEALIRFEVCRRQMHGLLVGYATIPMMVFGGAAEADILSYTAFCREIGIPTTLEEIGLGGITRSELMSACKAALRGATARAFPVPVSAEQLVEDTLAADALVRRAIEKGDVLQ